MRTGVRRNAAIRRRKRPQNGGLHVEHSADVVIIGGGVMGVSIAHSLARAGAGKIALLEKRFIGAGSSGKSGAIIRQHYSTSLLVQMARAGVTTFSDFESYVGADA